MKNGNYLNAVLTVIAVLMGLNLWVGVHGSPAGSLLDPSSEAMAQGRVDAGQQRADMIAELKALSGKVDALSTKLTDGSVKVSVTSMPEGD